MSLQMQLPTQSQAVRICPVLDFTEDAAFVAVKIPAEAGSILSERLAVITSNRKLFPWNEDSQFGDGIFADSPLPDCSNPDGAARVSGNFLAGRKCQPQQTSTKCQGGARDMDSYRNTRKAKIRLNGIWPL
jgi:hypothetical protein